MSSQNPKKFKEIYYKIHRILENTKHGGIKIKIIIKGPQDMNNNNLVIIKSPEKA